VNVSVRQNAASHGPAGQRGERRSRFLGSSLSVFPAVDNTETVVLFAGQILLLGSYIGADAHQRQVPYFWIWTLGGAVAGVFLLPVWWAFRPLRSGEVRRGGTPHLLMKHYALVWLAAGLVSILVTLGVGMYETQQAATGSGAGWAILGSGLGVIGSGCYWIVPSMLAYIAAVFAKEDAVERGPTGPLADQD
jgi:hypothetical protein